MGTGQRRPSRSPRSQRSRSADVDCLKKYTERRVEERRHTELPDTSKLDPSRWIPLTKSIPRVQPAGKKSPQTLRDEEKRRSVAEVLPEEPATDDSAKTTANASKGESPTRDNGEEETKGSQEKSETRSPAAPKPLPGRSLSTDVSHIKKEKRAEERRHTECTDPSTIATRWIPQINTSRFRYDASPFARISSSCEITRKAASRWMTFVRNPSPSPIPRMNPDRKSSAVDAPSNDQSKAVKKETPKWEPLRKFSPVASKVNRENNDKQDDADSNRDRVPPKKSPDSNDRSSRLSQRMRDLYDFKTENEWPKRATNPRRENTWISKSSSEEERNSHSVRRNSQDLEFNERMDRIKLKDTKVRTDSTEVFDDEERPKSRNEMLRRSEDLGLAKPRIKERRTYSDDYEEKARRASRLTRTDEFQDPRPSKDTKECKGNSDAGVRPQESRPSRGGVDLLRKSLRNSAASNASVSSSSAKRGSIECKSTRPLYEIPPRRAYSQTEERPATPVPPIEWNDDRYVARKLSAERQKRDSTRYKVYLT